jgi:hypothetical protein
MANIHILTGIQSDAGELETFIEGEFFESDYPLSNLQVTQPGKVARTIDDAEATTNFVLDADGSQTWQMFALINHNISTGATVRIRVANNIGFSPSVMDETITIDNSSVSWGSLPWGAFPWDGVEDEFPGGFTAFYLHDTPVSGGRVLIEVSDTNNPDGYVQIGRFLAGVPFTPTNNLQYGFSIGVVDDSKTERTIGGSVFVQEKPKRRRFNIELGFLTQAEAFEAHEILHQLGRGKGVLAVIDPEDESGDLMRRMLYGTLTDLGTITATQAAECPWSWQFTIEELVSGVG